MRRRVGARIGENYRDMFPLLTRCLPAVFSVDRQAPLAREEITQIYEGRGEARPPTGKVVSSVWQ